MLVLSSVWDTPGHVWPGVLFCTFKVLKTVILLLVLAFSLEASAQKLTDYLPGYIVIERESAIGYDTLKGLVADRKSTSTETRFLNKLMIIKNGKKERIPLSKAHGFMRDSTYYLVTGLKPDNRIQFLDNYYVLDKNMSNQVFLEVITSGSLNHYRHHWYEQGESSINSMEILQLAGKPYSIRADLGIFGLKKNLISRYFDSCPAITLWLNTHDTSIDHLVDYYYSECEKND